jgi:hypothetical protein
MRPFCMAFHCSCSSLPSPHLSSEVIASSVPKQNESVEYLQRCCKLLTSGGMHAQDVSNQRLWGD